MAHSAWSVVILQATNMVQVMKELRAKEKPLVIDADGLYIVTKNLDLVRGYPHAILTPNKNEYQRLASQLDIDIEQVRAMCPAGLAMTHPGCAVNTLP